MADQPDKMVQQKVVELEKKVAELERMWSQLKWAAAILGTAVLIVTGVGFVQIPRWASDEAVKKVTPIAEDAAKKAVNEAVGPAAIAELKKQTALAKNAREEAESARDRVVEIENTLRNTNALKLNNEVDRLWRRLADLDSITKKEDGLWIKSAFHFVDEKGRHAIRIDPNGYGNFPGKPQRVIYIQDQNQAVGVSMGIDPAGKGWVSPR